MQKQIFKEEQKYQRWELPLLISFLGAGLTYRFIEQQMAANSDNAMSVAAFAGILGLLMVILFYFRSLRLSVKMTNETISFRYHPWQEKKYKIKWSEVESYEIVKLSEAAQWNGWNIHYGNEKVFTVNGKSGIHISTKTGEQYFIGSSDVDSLAKAVEKLNI